MKYTVRIARRYLMGKKEFTFINIISFLATTGIAFGVAALIVVMSVFNGFNSLVTSILLDFDPHIKIEHAENEKPVAGDSLIHYLQRRKDIVGIAPYIQRKAMIVAREINLFAWVKGVDPEKLHAVSRVQEKLVIGDFTIQNGQSIVLGIALADKLRVMRGDTVTVISPAGMENVLTQFVTPTVMKYRVAGIYQSDNKIYDGSYAFISLPSAQTLFRMEEDITGFEIKLAEIDRSEAVKNDLEETIASPWHISTWYDLHKDLYSVMKIERWSAFVLLCVIIAVAVFNIFASLTMLALEKRRDIGILRSMGASSKEIREIFLYIGIIIGIIGTAIGMILGLTLCWLQLRYGFLHLDSAFIIPSLPVKIQFSDVLIISVSTLLLCILAAIYPASRAKNVLPAEAIRWE